MDVRTYTYPEKLDITGSAVALGYFDGVHVGHRELISMLVREAKAKKLKHSIKFSQQHRQVVATSNHLWVTMVHSRCRKTQLSQSSSVKTTLQIGNHLSILA